LALFASARSLPSIGPSKTCFGAKVEDSSGISRVRNDVPEEARTVPWRGWRLVRFRVGATLSEIRDVWQPDSYVSEKRLIQ
jgi:hypothetical protein